MSFFLHSKGLKLGPPRVAFCYDITTTLLGVLLTSFENLNKV